MGFLDKKEQVIDLEITQFGKQLISQGKFQPALYAFFDDDVLYDSQYAGFVEAQNDAQERIVKGTPSLAAQYSFSGRETKVKQINEFIRAGERTDDGRLKRLGSREVQQTPEKHYSLSAPLGTISLDSENAPAWSINILRGEVSSSVEFKQGDHQTVRIPQLAMGTVEWLTTVIAGEPPKSEDESLVEDENISQEELVLESFTRKFEDGSFLKTFQDSIILEVEELNTFFEKENFDIEVYEIEEEEELFQAGVREILKPLYFLKKKPEVVNDILQDPEDLEFDNPELDPSYVEYFFDVLVDDEIDPDVLCALNPTDNPEGLFGQRFIDCKPITRKIADPLYVSNVKEEDIEGPC